MRTMKSRRGRDKRGKKHPTGSRRPPGGGPGTEMMMMETETGMTLMIVITVSSVV